MSDQRPFALSSLILSLHELHIQCSGLFDRCLTVDPFGNCGRVHTQISRNEAVVLQRCLLHSISEFTKNLVPSASEAPVCFATSETDKCEYHCFLFFQMFDSSAQVQQ